MRIGSRLDPRDALRVFTSFLIPALFAGGAAAQEARSQALVQPGTDFCFMRKYDAAHMKSHPRQIVTSIRIMGRNAWKIDGTDRNQMAATVTVTFRDRKAPLPLYGLCFDKDRQPGSLKCGLVPGDLQDVLSQTIELHAEGERVLAVVSSDWLVIRAGKEPDGPYGEPKTDDVEFLLDSKRLSACRPSRALWGSEGVTSELMRKLP